MEKIPEDILKELNLKNKLIEELNEDIKKLKLEIKYRSDMMFELNKEKKEMLERLKTKEKFWGSGNENVSNGIYTYGLELITPQIAKTLDAFHSNWTKPFFAYKGDNKEYFMEDFELLTMMLSALEWRKYNGSIKMYTDLTGKAYYERLGISHIWDLGIETILENIENEIDPFLFWAAGKLYSLEKVKTPCIMLDTDFIVWNKLCMDKKGIYAVHRENLESGAYIGKESFDMKENYIFDKEWDWNELPCNTAFLYIQDMNFKDYYVKKSIEFMKNCLNGKDTITNMVFAEQRLLAMCAKQKNVNINSLMEFNNINQQNFTHLWGYKKELKNNISKRKDFCIQCIKRILYDFPEEEKTIANIEMLNKYYKEII